MDAVDDRRNGTSLLPGHQDHTPNSDATRLRLDHPTTDTLYPPTNSNEAVCPTRQLLPTGIVLVITCSGGWFFVSAHVFRVLADSAYR
jgi:hypothetical protein